ncbi:MAG: LacI family DNA-binding transcriptional regulator, partial [Coprobacillus sp.]
MEKSQKVTIKDIAEMAGTSKTTVSFYLNGKTEKMSDETKDRIAKVIEE